MQDPRGKDGRAPIWRPLRAGDLGAVVRIADALHPDAHERPEVFAEKLQLFPDGCFALEGNGAVVGYAICHPWLDDHIPALDAFLGAIPNSPSCLYVHDVAILTGGRGYGASTVFIDLAIALARKLALGRLALVSLYGSQILWSRLGFVSVRSRALSARLASYGPEATYMKRSL